MLSIVTKKNGHRRAGVAHFGAKFWPDGAFTPEQLADLKADPNLIVEELTDEFVEEAEDGKLLLDGEEVSLVGPEGEAPSPEETAAPEKGKSASGKGKK